MPFCKIRTIAHLRKLVEAHDNSWLMSFKTLFKGEHQDVLKIKEFVETLKREASLSELSPHNLLKLLRIITISNEQFLIQNIKDNFDPEFLKIITLLETLRLLNETNLSKIIKLDSQLSALIKLLTDLEQNNNALAFKSLDADLKQKVFEMLLKFILKSSPEKVLNFLYLLSEEDFVFIKTEKIPYFVNIISNLLEANIKIDKELIKNIRVNEHHHHVKKISSLLLKKDMLNDDNFILILQNANSSINNEIQTIFKNLISDNSLDNDILKLLYTCKKGFRYAYTLEKLSEFKLVDKNIAIQLFNDIDPVSDLFLHLMPKLDQNTTQRIIDIFKKNNTKVLLALFEILKEPGISDHTLTALFATVKLESMIIILHRLPNSLRNHDIVNEILSLNDSQFNLLYHFLLKKEKWDNYLNQDTIQTILRDLKSLPLQSSVTTTDVWTNHCNDQDVADYICDNFYTLSQYLIEEHYLQSFAAKKSPAAKKLNLRDGDIEREIHGAMHVGRVNFYVKVIYQLFKELFVKYVTQAMAQLTKDFNLSEKQIIILTRFAALCHDIERETEGKDKWEKESGMTCTNILKKIGLSEKLANFFGNLITHKDNPNELKKFLCSMNVPEDSEADYQFLRKLINLADCFDIMRCNGHFYFIYILKNITDIKEYNPVVHQEKFLELAKQIHRLIFVQKDMLFDTKIILPNEEQVELSYSGSSYSLANKVKFEHAENVLSVLAKSMREFVYFEKYLTDEQVLSTKFASCQVAFNPYIHGSTTLAFINLTQTQNKLLPIIKMLEEYGIAPQGGEIVKGGLKMIQSGNELSLGRMRIYPEHQQDYTLSKILANYANSELCKVHNKQSVITDLKKALIDGYKMSYYNLNIILVYIGRAKQLGINTEQIAAEINTTDLLKKVNATKQLFYLLLLLDTYIKPNPETLILKDKNDISDALFTHLTFFNLIDKIVSHHIDLKTIYQNPTVAGLEEVIQLLTIPQNSMIKRPGNESLRTVSLTHTKFFCASDGKRSTGKLLTENDNFHTKQEIETIFEELISFGSEREKINQILSYYWSGRLHPISLKYIENKVIDFLSELEKRELLLTKLLKSDNLTSNLWQSFFITNRFPVIFVCENDEKISLDSFSDHEFRTKESLKIGDDIKMIATDTESHRLILMKYLKQNHIHNVSVVLFIDLIWSQETKQRPKSSYCHLDGFPRLSWLAARKYTADSKYHSGNKELDKVIDNASEYNRIIF